MKDTTAECPSWMCGDFISVRKEQTVSGRKRGLGECIVDRVLGSLAGRGSVATGIRAPQKTPKSSSGLLFSEGSPEPLHTWSDKTLGYTG